MDEVTTLLLRTLVTLLLVVANGFFVAAEFAIVKARPTRIEQLAAGVGGRYILARTMIQDVDRYLSATQLGITLASLGLGWVGEQSLSDVIIALLGPLAMKAEVTVHVVAAVIAFVVITFLQIVLGEMVPKTMAIRLTDATVVRTARPLHLFYRVTFPVIWLLNRSAEWTFSLFGWQQPTEAEMAHSEEELRMIVSQSHESGIIDEAERTLFDNVFDFTERVAREVMVPRTDMVCLYESNDFEENFRVAVADQHTRYPLCGEDKDDIIGIVHVRDLYEAALRRADSDVVISRIARPVVRVTETMPINRVLRLLQHGRSEMAIVMDEYGGTSGLLTTEDILEELVGEIQDEFDEERPAIEPLGQDRWSIDGRLRTDELEELFGGTKLRLIEGVDTVGGWMYAALDARPYVGAFVDEGEWRLEVGEMGDSRVLRIVVRRRDDEKERGQTSVASEGDRRGPVSRR